jgi:serine/threonine protein kinase
MEEPGLVVSRYRVLSEIGRGAMGTVYKAEDIQDAGRLVALKFLAKQFVRDGEALARFAREAQAAASLQHPNICAVFESGIWQDRPFIAMELLDGWTLHERLAIRKLYMAEALEIGVQALDGLAVAHQAGIVHRDIKPANLFITRRGVVKLLDFGLAKVRMPLPSEDASTGAFMLTRPGTLIGTYAYMAPEQVRSEALDGRADLYSLGVVLYEAIHGGLPMPGRPASIFDRFLVRDRSARYPDAAQARQELVAELARVRSAVKSQE